MKRFAVVLLLVAGLAYADSVWRKRVAVSGVSQVFCFDQFGPRGSIGGCPETIHIAYGYKLADGGTKNVSDAGAPLVATTADEPAPFPADGSNYKIDLGLGEQCIALITHSGDAGSCDIYGRTVSP